MNKQSLTKKISGKRILFTNHSLKEITGAAINSIELAMELEKYNIKCDFFSYEIGGEFTEFIEKRFKTKVLTDNIDKLALSDDIKDLKNTNINIEDYDYIWVGANVIPISFLQQYNNAKKRPWFLFAHMSSLVGYPLDAPLFPDFEKNVDGSILSISKETTHNTIERILGSSIPILYWPNPAPQSFVSIKSKKNKKLKNVGIISSSNPSEEIIKAGKIFSKMGIDVEYVGGFSGNIKLIDSSFYKEQDLIIGIGKNVQYSLVSGVPIYVYGRFGGPGYLNEKNFDKAANYNFSGRGFNKKTSNIIVEEIITDFENSSTFHDKYRKSFIKEYSIREKVYDVFGESVNKKPKKKIFKIEEINWLVSSQINLMQRLKTAEEAMLNFEDKIKWKTKVEELQEVVKNKDKEITHLVNSKSWRITKPLRYLAKYFLKTTP